MLWNIALGAILGVGSYVAPTYFGDSISQFFAPERAQAVEFKAPERF